MEFYVVSKLLERLDLEVVLVREHLLAPLAAQHALLLLLTSVRGRNLLLSLGLLDRVSESIVLDLLLADNSIGLVDTGTRSLALPNKLAVFYV